MPTASGNGLYRGEEDKVAMFYVDVGLRQGELGVKVDGKCILYGEDKVPMFYVDVGLRQGELWVKVDGKCLLWQFLDIGYYVGPLHKHDGIYVTDNNIFLPFPLDKGCVPENIHLCILVCIWWDLICRFQVQTP